MPDSKRPPTYRDIALRAGVSVASVSLGLRDDPRISVAVRERIRKVAEEMGYRPNPLLAAYQASVRAQKPTKFQAMLGWINDSLDENSWHRPFMKPLLDGAKARASELGYQLDEIWVPNIREEDPAGNFRRWERILSARGIHGVLLPYLYRQQHYVLPWANFSVVSLGKHHALVEESSIHIPEKFEHHRVASDYTYNIRLAIARLRESGCRRIGLAISRFLDSETDHTYSAQFLWFSSEWPSKERVPILFSDHEADIQAWAKKHRPDAVICGHSSFRKALAEAGLDVPNQTRLAHLNVAPDVPDWSGIDRRMPVLGSAAVDMVTAHLQRNERGVPPYAKEMIIEGVWVEGKT